MDDTPARAGTPSDAPAAQPDRLADALPDPATDTVRDTLPDTVPAPTVEDAPGRPQRQAEDPAHEQRVRAAWIYYIEGRTQNEVAQELGITRVAVTRLLSEAKRRAEVTVNINSPIAPLIALERRLEKRHGFERAVVAPRASADMDATRLIAAAAGPYVSAMLGPDMTVGVGWGRTLHAMLGHLVARPLANMRVVSLLGGIAEAKRFNPAEFAWAFAEFFDAEGFLVPAPALVDSAATRHALLERCGLDQVFQIAEASDVTLISCGGISTLNTSYRLGHLTEDERNSLVQAGAVGDVLYNFLDAAGNVVDHSINRRCMSIGLDRLRRVRHRVLISGGEDKIGILRAAIASLRPTVLITDELTALTLCAPGA